MQRLKKIFQQIEFDRDTKVFFAVGLGFLSLFVVASVGYAGLGRFRTGSAAETASISPTPMSQVAGAMEDLTDEVTPSATPSETQATRTGFGSVLPTSTPTPTNELISQDQNDDGDESDEGTEEKNDDSADDNFPTFTPTSQPTDIPEPTSTPSPAPTEEPLSVTMEISKDNDGFVVGASISANRIISCDWRILEAGNEKIVGSNIILEGGMGCRIVGVNLNNRELIRRGITDESQWNKLIVYIRSGDEELRLVAE